MTRPNRWSVLASFEELDTRLTVALRDLGDQLAAAILRAQGAILSDACTEAVAIREELAAREKAAWAARRSEARARSDALREREAELTHKLEQLGPEPAHPTIEQAALRAALTHQLEEVQGELYG